MYRFLTRLNDLYWIIEIFEMTTGFATTRSEGLVKLQVQHEACREGERKGRSMKCYVLQVDS
jgi:hypothetical protein